MSARRLVLIVSPALVLLMLVACVLPPIDPPLGDGAQKIYVANEDSGSLSVIDGATLTVSTTIELDGADMPMPHNVQVAPDGASVWATAMPMMEGGDDVVLIIDPATDTVSEQLTLGNDLHLAHVVLSADSTTAFVTASESGEVLHLDTTNHAIVDRHALAVGAYPHGARVCGDKLYVAEMDAMSLAVLDHDAETLQEIDVGGQFEQLARQMQEGADAG